MKKGVIVGIIVALLLLSVLFINSISAKESKNPKIEQEVLDKIGQDGKARVIVTLKDNDFDSKGGLTAAASLSRKNVIESIGKEKVKHEFSSFNSFSAAVSQKELESLEADERVESIQYDVPVRAFLQDSVPLINASRTWPLQVNGINLTGTGETICIIDTGINYSHVDLGGCNIKNLSLQGNNESYILESQHNYSNNNDTTWKINYTGFSNIGVHFVNISTEVHWDHVVVYDGQMNMIATYSGFHEDLWAPYAEGDTIYIRLNSDVSITDYGFYIDQIINGTTNTTYNWSSCPKVIGGWDIYNSDPDPADDYGHGTHCAGIAAANGTITGVAPEAKIVAIKTLSDVGDGWQSDIIKSIEWCTNNSEEYNISVISMSLGTDCSIAPTYCFSNYCDAQQSAYSNAINAAVRKNISVVIATGNNGNKTSISSPACIQNATAVGATMKTDAIASFSNRNSITDLFAPGDGFTLWGGIYSTWRDGGYTTMSGTSMATPHVAGAFALIRQFYRLDSNRILTPIEIQNVLNNTGKLIDDSGGSGLNFSRINVYNAIISLDSSNPSVNLISPDNNLVNNSAVSLNITFECNATDNLGLKNLTFYLWNSTGIYNQTFSSLSGASDDFELNITNLQEGDYKWNCLVYDLSGNSAFASSNYSIDYDTIAPSISLVSPSEGYSTTGTTIDFEYNTTENTNIANCGLIINNAIDSYNSSEISNSTNTISKNLSVGVYTWSINCTDLAGNIGNSSSRSLTINQAATSRNGGSSGGIRYLTYNITNDQLSEGYTNSLRKGDKITFSSDSKSYSLTISYVGTNFANITIRNATTLALKIGESAKLNLSSKYYYDLLVKLEGIASNKANITIKSIYEKIAPVEENESVPIPPSYDVLENKSDNKTYPAQTITKGNQNYLNYGYIKITIFALIIIVLSGFVFHFHKKRKEEIKLKKFLEQFQHPLNPES
jgi:subtilisin family serine protease